VTADVFQIPVARDRAGRLVPPGEARKGAVYRCPSCDGIVDLHAGEKKRRHFHHRRSACSAETVSHLAAKELVARAVTEWIDGLAPPPVFVRRCAHEGCERTTRQAMPRKVRAARVEYRLHGGRVVDVALLAKGVDLPVAAVEVHVSHAVDDEKRRELAIPWIEVLASQICDDGGRVLVPTQDRLLPWLCEDHADERGEARRESRETRRALQAVVQRLPYRLEDFPGFRVHALARCARGHDAIVWAWDGDHPPWPRPPHVVAVSGESDWTFSKATGRGAKTLAFRRRYASACPSCGARLPEAPG